MSQSFDFTEVYAHFVPLELVLLAEALPGWRGVRMGSQISRSNATAFWISWAPDPSLLVGSHSLPKEYMSTPRGQYKRLACEFVNYPKVTMTLSISSCVHCQCPNGVGSYSRLQPVAPLFGQILQQERSSWH